MVFNEKILTNIPFVRDKLFTTYVALQQSLHIPKYYRLNAIASNGISEDEAIKRLDRMATNKEDKMFIRV